MDGLPEVGERASHCLDAENEASRRAGENRKTEKTGRRVEQKRWAGGRGGHSVSSVEKTRNAMVMILLLLTIYPGPK